MDTRGRLGHRFRRVGVCFKCHRRRAELHRCFIRRLRGHLVELGGRRQHMARPRRRYPPYHASCPGFGPVHRFSHFDYRWGRSISSNATGVDRFSSYADPIWRRDHRVLFRCLDDWVGSFFTYHELRTSVGNHSGIFNTRPNPHPAPTFWRRNRHFYIVCGEVGR